MNFPTKLVGGDYYDCVPLSDGRFAFIMADVAGKGIPAALLVSSFHASLNAFLESQLSLTQLAHKLNAAMYRASTEERYITALIAILTPHSGQIELLNAGHNAAYLLRADGNVDELSNGGIALGMLDMDFPYPTDSITLASGDRLLLYTDGITEAMNAKQEQYDNLRPLKNFFEQKRNLDAEPFVKELINDVRDHVGTAPQSDDITAMIIIRR
jgi:sigma-B regulation protein RsbU (phosphoserine phosphatase)